MYFWALFFISFRFNNTQLQQRNNEQQQND